MAPESPKPDNVIDLGAANKAVTEAMQPKPQPEPEPQQEADPRSLFLNELIATIQAAEALRENKNHTIRTKELDIEKAQAARLINQFLSKNAFDAVRALEFMHLVVPQMIGNVGAIFAQHPMTHMPLVDALNGIARAKKQAMEHAKAKAEGDDNAETTEQRSETD